MAEDNKLVTLSHELTRAAYTLSLNEKRLLLRGASLLDTYGETGQLIEIHSSECAEFYGMNRASAYKQLRLATERLWDRTLVLPDGTKMRWVITCKYEDSSIKIKFHPDLNPHLLDLQKRFTRYLLSRAASFKLMYTWRLFELIMQFKKTGYLKIELDEFKKILDTPKSYDKDFGLIRSKVINPAIKEIKEKDGLDIKFNVIKKGRSVVALEFKFPIEVQKKLALIDDEFINKYVAANPDTTRGKTYDQIIKMIKAERKKATET